MAILAGDTVDELPEPIFPDISEMDRAYDQVRLSKSFRPTTPEVVLITLFNPENPK